MPYKYGTLKTFEVLKVKQDYHLSIMIPV